ncbi:hypothetical protein ABZV78_13620, partial [Micromonospora sp. NPDC004540]|uniref:hypothetical protein n=1 Tax=Micromonospora sp. NPDC004540 TaxID=3154457 RepID=UPI0033A7EC8E
PKMRRRSVARSGVESVPVAHHGAPLADFTPADYARQPATGWTAETLWAAAWGYAYTHGDGARGVALVAFRDFSRAYDRSRNLQPSSARSVVRQDVEARLRGVRYSAGPEEVAE